MGKCINGGEILLGLPREKVLPCAAQCSEAVSEGTPAPRSSRAIKQSGVVAVLRVKWGLVV